MRTLNYIILCGLIMVALGMASPPKKPVYPPFTSNIIDLCTNDCQSTNNRTDCSSICINDTLDAINENRNAIINKFGNVL